MGVLLRVVAHPDPRNTAMPNVKTVRHRIAFISSSPARRVVVLEPGAGRASRVRGTRALVVVGRRRAHLACSGWRPISRANQKAPEASRHECGGLGTAPQFASRWH